jgi:hypothetical protein
MRLIMRRGRSGDFRWYDCPNQITWPSGSRTSKTPLDPVHLLQLAGLSASPCDRRVHGCDIVGIEEHDRRSRWAFCREVWSGVDGSEVNPRTSRAKLDAVRIRVTDLETKDVAPERNGAIDVARTEPPAHRCGDVWLGQPRIDGGQVIDQLRPAVEPILTRDGELRVGQFGGRVSRAELRQPLLGALAQLFDRGTCRKRGWFGHTISSHTARVRPSG